MNLTNLKKELKKAVCIIELIEKFEQRKAIIKKNLLKPYLFAYQVNRNEYSKDQERVQTIEKAIERLWKSYHKIMMGA